MKKNAEKLISKNEMNWSIDKSGVLTIEGQGKIPDCDCGRNPSAPWENVKDQILEICIEEGITEIGINAFNSCRNLQKVVLPSSLRRIHAYAFRNCMELICIETDCKDMKYIYDNREYDEENTIIFGIDSFQNVPWCRSRWGAFYIQDNILYITFVGAEKQLVVPEGVRMLKSFSMSHLDVDSIAFPNTLEQIEDFAFFDSTIKEALILPQSTHTVGLYAFADSNILRISFPVSIRPDKMEWYRTEGKMVRRSKKSDIINRYSLRLLERKKFGKFRKLEVVENKPIHHRDGTVTNVRDDKTIDVGESIYRRIRMGNILLCVSYENNRIHSVKSFSWDREEGLADEYLMYPVLDPGEQLLPWRDSFTYQEKEDIIYAFNCFDGEELHARGALRRRHPDTHEEWFWSNDRENFGGPLELDFLEMWLSLHPEVTVDSTDDNMEKDHVRWFVSV